MALVETAKFPSAVATEGDMLNWKNVGPAQALPTLSANIAATDTSIVLSAGSGSVLPSDNFVISIDSEIILVKTRSTDTLSNLTRGYEGTTAASHSAGTKVTQNVTAKAHNQMVSEVYSIESQLGANMQNVRRNGTKSLTVAVGSNQTPSIDVKSYDCYKFTLQANVTSSTLANAVLGQFIVIILVQDATGGRSFAWPANFIGAGNVAGNAVAANAVARQMFWFDGTNAYAITPLMVN